MAPATKHGPDPASLSSSSSSFTSTLTESSDHHHHSNNHSNQSQDKKHNHNIRHRDNHKAPSSKDITNTRNDNKLATTATNTQPPNRSLISSIAMLLRMDRRSDQDENPRHQGSRHVSEPELSFEAQHSADAKEQARTSRHRPSQTTSELAHSLESNYRMLPLMIGCIVPVSMSNHSFLPFSFPPFLHPPFFTPFLKQQKALGGPAIYCRVCTSIYPPPQGSCGHHYSAIYPSIALLQQAHSCLIFPFNAC